MPCEITTGKKRKIIICVIVISTLLLAGYGGYKYYIWRPYSTLVRFTSYKSIAKWWLTILLSSSAAMNARSQPLRFKDGELYIASKSNSPGCSELLDSFPPPECATNEKCTWRYKVNSLRNFTSKLLPERSSLPQSPEPVRAVDILGINPQQKKYPKLCSKLAKIFVQYLNCLSLVARIIDLKDHTSAEVWNPDSNKWECQDPFFDSAATHDGKYLSAEEAYGLMVKGQKINFKGPVGIFNTVVYVPRLNYANDHLPNWHYFSYDNLAYWKVICVSAKSRPLWRGRK